ncbi:transcription/translation regulatory transformer protein RfaH [Pseudomonas citronellolis]|uniref:transcription/translation regulatory transformer protein RfaH n=1 Tax=Pseudomonas citronellolis TaxID=53408 RepID=UPI000778E914|nr:transcription/translation regulatory transformer protein RfaH [Pseudomonas citronellolis]WRT80328.1 transcription/translation regulatory transformer protein RfaH [Pseudomonas citronellolis]
MPDTTGKRWYLVQCKPRQAPRALEHLERQGYECLLPMHQIERLHKGQLQQFSEPLFPGYIFICLDKVEDNWLPIRSTRGVSRIVSFGGQPTPVPEGTILDITNKKSKIAPVFEKGNPIEIFNSGLPPIEAIFLEKNGEERVLLLLHLLQRNIVIDAPLGNIRKIGI